MIQSHTAFAAAAVLAIAGAAQAQLLNLVPTLPDASAGFVLVTYNATTQQFRASGRSQNLNLPPNTSLNNGTFLLTAQIDNTGALVGNSGTLTVTNGSGGAVVFSGSQITAFGAGATRRFEFIFASDGTGSAGSIAGSSIGTIINGNGLPFTTPTWTANFTNAVTPGSTIGQGSADTFLIPSPAAAGVFGLAGVAALRRRRK